MNKLKMSEAERSELANDHDAQSRKNRKMVYLMQREELPILSYLTHRMSRKRAFE